jgi:hypothetical protein
VTFLQSHSCRSPNERNLSRGIAADNLLSAVSKYAYNEPGDARRQRCNTSSRNRRWLPRSMKNQSEERFAAGTGLSMSPAEVSFNSWSFVHTAVELGYPSAWSWLTRALGPRESSPSVRLHRVSSPSHLAVAGETFQPCYHVKVERDLNRTPTLWRANGHLHPLRLKEPKDRVTVCCRTGHVCNVVVDIQKVPFFRICPNSVRHVDINQGCFAMKRQTRREAMHSSCCVWCSQ